MSVVLGLRCDEGAVLLADSGWFSEGVNVRAVESKLWTVERRSHAVESAGHDVFGFSGDYHNCARFREWQLKTPGVSAFADLQAAEKAMCGDPDAYLVAASRDGKLFASIRGKAPMEFSRFISVGAHWKETAGATTLAFQLMKHDTLDDLVVLGTQVMKAIVDLCVFACPPVVIYRTAGR